MQERARKSAIQNCKSEADTIALNEGGTDPTRELEISRKSVGENPGTDHLRISVSESKSAL